MLKYRKIQHQCMEGSWYRFDCRLIAQLVQLLFATGQKEFKSPLTNVVHCLITLPFDSSQSDLFPKDSPTKVVQHVINTLDRSLPEDTESISDTSLDENLSPVISLLSSFYQVAPDSVQASMKQSLLPTEEYVLKYSGAELLVIESSQSDKPKVYKVVSSVS